MSHDIGSGRTVCISFAIALIFLTAPIYTFANVDISPVELITKPSLTTRDPTGAFQHSIPIVVPPGRNGLQSDLKLTYNNREDDVNNLFGHGWTINIPYIQRINKKGSETLYSFRLLFLFFPRRRTFNDDRYYNHELCS